MLNQTLELVKINIYVE